MVKHQMARCICTVSAIACAIIAAGVIAEIHTSVQRSLQLPNSLWATADALAVCCVRTDESQEVCC